MIRLATLSLLASPSPFPPRRKSPAHRSPAPTDRSLDRFSALRAAVAAVTGPALKPAVTIVGEIVRIGDLVENAGAAANIAIFRAPDLGQTGRVAVERVIEAVLPHEIVDIETRGLTEVVVTRASTTITAKDIETAHHAGARRPAAQHRCEQSHADLRQRSPHHPHRAGQRPAHRAHAFDPRSGRFDVLFERAGSTRTLLRYTGTYAETFEAAVLARPLAAGEVVRAADVTIVRRPKTEFAANIITTAEQAIGLAARRAMRPGDVLRQTDLAKPEVVARNDNVTITFQVPGITLTMRGKALEGGAHGDTINVLNVQSKRSIQAHHRRTGPCHRGRDHAGQRHARRRRRRASPPRPPAVRIPPRKRAPAPSERHDSCIAVIRSTRSDQRPRIRTASRSKPR